MVYIVHKNYENYIQTMLFISIAGHFVLFIGYFIVPETLIDYHNLNNGSINNNDNDSSSKRRSLKSIFKNASPINTIRFFNQYTELRRLAIVILTSCLSVSIYHLLQLDGYTLHRLLTIYIYIYLFINK